MIVSAPSTRSIDWALRPVTMRDLAGAVALINLCAREITGQDEDTLEGIQNMWTDPGINLDTDMRIVEQADGEMIGYVEVWNTPPHESSWIWARVHPDHRGQGIGTALMDWAEEHARQQIEKAPEGVRVTITAGCHSTHLPSLELLNERGFQPVRRFYQMTIDLDGPPPVPARPAGITVRPMRQGEERAVYAASTEAFKDHWGHVEEPFEEGFALWQHRRLNDPDFDPTLWFLALDGEEIAGLSLCRAKTAEDPEMGWVNSLGVRRPWRKQGLALALLYHSFGELYGRGRRKVGLGVDATSLTGATRLYEKAGMRAIREFITFEKELRAGKNLATHTLED